MKHRFEAPGRRNDLRSCLPFDLDRLRFRALEVGDVARFHKYRSDEEVARYQGWAPMTLFEARQFVEEQMNAVALGLGSWTQLAIADRGSNILVGDIGVWISADGSEAEIGLTVAPEFQGRGFGTEAIRCIIDFLMRYSAVSVVTAATDVRNIPCLRALSSAGMEPEGTRETEYKGELCTEQVYRWRKPDVIDKGAS